MGQLQPVQDTTGTMSSVEINTQAINLIMQEMNRGVDATTIQRRSITGGQIKVIAYQPSPFSLSFSGTTPIQVPAGSYSSLVINFTNNGLTSAAGQTLLPICYVDLFVDPPDVSSTANIYANSGKSVYPDGVNVTTAMANLTFTWYLRNSTPAGSGNALFSYVFTIRNQDSAAHFYYISTQILLPSDGNLNNGNTAVYIP